VSPQHGGKRRGAGRPKGTTKPWFRERALVLEAVLAECGNPTKRNISLACRRIAPKHRPS
jgi:hypothetical protein